MLQQADFGELKKHLTIGYVSLFGNKAQKATVVSWTVLAPGSLQYKRNVYILQAI